MFDKPDTRAATVLVDEFDAGRSFFQLRLLIARDVFRFELLGRIDSHR